MNWFTDLVASDQFRSWVICSGVLVAIGSIHASRQIARRKQAADLLFASRNDSVLQDGYKCLHTYHNATDKNLRSLVDEQNRESHDATCVRYVLNHLELVAVGIQNDIYDENMLKECWFNIVVSTYEKAQPFISAARAMKKTNSIYQEFEWLAVRWQSKPLKVKSKSFK